MHESISKYGILLLCLLVMPVAPRFSRAAQPPAAPSSRGSVVKIHVTIQRYNYLLPWQGSRPVSGTGTGFIIGKRRILTNAHIVSDARFLQVQKDGDPRRYRARVTFVADDCDLATLTVDSPDFFENLHPLRFAERMPELDDEVSVLGYPLGGDRLSVTHGVVSRIDYSTYAHSAVDQHLVLQVDAAINPGNSGGPILYKDRIVGLAFQGLAWAENIGYAIPLPVLMHFLEDIEDGAYHGYPELGVGYLETRNPALRDSLRIPDGASGVAVLMVDPFGSARQILREGDVLTDIDGHAIAADGTIKLDGDVVIFPEILERKQWGDSVELTVWRDNGELTLGVPLTNPYDPFVYRNTYNVRPRYYLYGGLVFAPLSRGLLNVAVRSRNVINTHQLQYYTRYAKVDRLYEGCDEFVVLVNRLPHQVNTYAQGFRNGILTHVNGIRITGLNDVKKAIRQKQDGFHVMRFANMDDSLILDARAAEQADAEIMSAYGVSSRERLRRLGVGGN